MKNLLKVVGMAGVAALVGAVVLGAVAFAQDSFGSNFGQEFRNGFTFGQDGPRRDGFGEGFRQGEDGPHRGPRGARPIGGKVTAVGDNSITILTRKDETVVVNVSDETKVRLAESDSEGTLSDIEVNDNVGVHGRKNDDGSVDAQEIMVLPDGDMVGGRVTAVDGNTISVENPEGEMTIITNGDTQFRLGKDGAGSLSDVTVDKGVMAFGEAQEDGSVVARFVFVHEGRGPGRGGPGGHGPPGPGGKVTAVSDNSITILTRKDETVVVNVSDETKVRLAESDSEGTLSDIEVNDNVGVHGRKNDDGSVDAQGIMVLPDGDIAGGRVTAVDGNTISVENPEGEMTIITNGDTQFRLGKDGAGSLSDVTVDKGVMAFGEAQEDGSVVARFVFVHEGRGHGEGGPGRRGPGGEVTAIDGTTLTLQTPRGDELTVLTDENTEYRTRGDEEVSFDDIEVGSKIGVKGQPVEGQEHTIKAEVIGIKTK